MTQRSDIFTRHCSLCKHIGTTYENELRENEGLRDAIIAHKHRSTFHRRRKRCFSLIFPNSLSSPFCGFLRGAKTCPLKGKCLLKTLKGVGTVFKCNESILTYSIMRYKF